MRSSLTPRRRGLAIVPYVGAPVEKTQVWNEDEAPLLRPPSALVRADTPMQNRSQRMQSGTPVLVRSLSSRSSACGSQC